MSTSHKNGTGEANASPAPPSERCGTTANGLGEGRGVVPAHAVKKGAAGHRRWQKMNRPLGAFIWFTLEMLQSPAWSMMPLSARRVVERVAIEHMKHGGTLNGSLVVTYDDFQKFGVRRKSIAPAIEKAVALGFLDVTGRGFRSYGIARRPSTYALTWLPRCDGTPASNRWRKITEPAAE
jgi:hypothetical protein